MARSLNEDCWAFFVGRMKPDILLVSTSDRAGGAEQIARSLLAGYREHGCATALAVGTKFSPAPDVHEIPRNRSAEFVRRGHPEPDRAGRSDSAANHISAFASG